MLTEQEILQEKEQLNEVAPLLAFLFGIFAKAGYDRNQAANAAKAAAAAAEQQAPGAATAVTQTGQPNPQGADYNQAMRRGSRGEGVKQLQQNLGMSQADGIFGPATERAVRTFQQSQGLQVDGIVGPETRDKIARLANNGAQAARPGNPVDDGGLGQRSTQTASKENRGNPVNEEITITGDPESLIRMMKLAGAGDAKELDADDINTKVGSCGDNRNGDLARSISLIADEDWDNSPDEDVADFDANPPSNDLNKSKKSYPPAAGGDNPMALENELRAKLSAALEEKKK